MQLIDFMAMMNIAQHKGQPRDQPSSPATVSTPRAVVRKSPSPLPARHVRDRTPKVSVSSEKVDPQPGQIAIVWKALTVHHAQDLHTHLDLLTGGRIHHWTSGRPSRQMQRKRHLAFPMEKMRKVPGKCLLHNMHSSDVTLSKGCFKIVTVRTKRAARASLFDLGEEVDKTTFSEMLNAESSTFKHFTVKQVFPQKPSRLKMHKDALYQTKPPNIDGFGEWKLPANFQMSQRMAMDTKELVRR